MQSLTVWHWIIIAIVIGLAVVAIFLFARAINNRRPKDRTVKDRSSIMPDSGPSGFQGLLLLLAVSVIGSPVLTRIPRMNSRFGANWR